MCADQRRRGFPFLGLWITAIACRDSKKWTWDLRAGRTLIVVYTEPSPVCALAMRFVMSRTNRASGSMMPRELQSDACRRVLPPLPACAVERLVCALFLSGESPTVPQNTRHATAATFGKSYYRSWFLHLDGSAHPAAGVAECRVLKAGREGVVVRPGIEPGVRTPLLR